MRYPSLVCALLLFDLTVNSTQALPMGLQTSVAASGVLRQAVATEAPSVDSDIPAWQVAAGGHKEFDVASLGLTGNYDLVLSFSPEVRPGTVNVQNDTDGPTFLEAIKDQLGLKLEQQTGQVVSIGIDHVEQPTEN
jgi:hypothetical protein